MTAAQTARQLLTVNAQMRDLKYQESNLAAIRRHLIGELTGTHRWPQKRVASLLGITQQRVSTMLRTGGYKDAEDLET